MKTEIKLENIIGVENFSLEKIEKRPGIYSLNINADRILIVTQTCQMIYLCKSFGSTYEVHKFERIYWQNDTFHELFTTVNILFDNIRYDNTIS